MAMKDKNKKTLMPKLRFPEFKDGSSWMEAKLGDIISTLTPPKKLLTSGYLSQGAIPVVDQSPEAVSGWTDDAEAVINSPLPVIVFGDHTCVVKLIRQPFAQGADGIKIFRSEPTVDTEYLFHNLSNRPLVMEDYKRHFSILKERRVYYPDPRTAEQQKIAKCMTSLDELFVAKKRKLEALRAHKKGLMQQLFPREGEYRPRLRFPEFHDAGAWETHQLGELLSRPPEYGVNAPAVTYSPSLPTYIRITDIDADGNFLAENKASVDIDTVGDHYLAEDDVVLARTGASVGKSYRYRPDDGRLVFAGFLIRVRPDKSKLDSVFLSAFLATRRYWDWVVMTSARSGQPGINGPEFASLPILIPPVAKTDKRPAEQQRIAACFGSLDALIAAQLRKLDGLRAHKRGLMQQLFPAPEAV